MIVRLFGLGLIAFAAAFAWFFLWRPVAAGETDLVGPAMSKLLVLVPLAALSGLSLLVGGTAAARAFRPTRTRAQTTFVIVVLLVAMIFTGLLYWWYREQRFLITGEGASNLLLQFYGQRRSMDFYGLPNDTQLEALAPSLSEGFVAALRAARVEQARCVAKHPTDIPQWSQGDLFTSHFEGHTMVGVRSVARGQFDLHFEYFRGGEHFTWRDRAIMSRERGRWVLDDVWFRVSGEARAPGAASLRTALAARGC